MLANITFLIGEKSKAKLDGNALCQGVDDEEEDYSERGIDVHEPPKPNKFKKEKTKSKKIKQGHYIIDIEPLEQTDPDIHDMDSKLECTKYWNVFDNTREGEENKQQQFVRSTSGRSTIDESGVSGSLDVHINTNVVPSPTSLETPLIKGGESQGSLCNKFYLETELPIYEKVNKEPFVKKDNVTKAKIPESTSANGSENVSKKVASDGNNQDNDEEYAKGPPQVWISKSLSMEELDLP